GCRERPGSGEELNKTVWEVPQRLQGLRPVGSGAYGSVCRCPRPRVGSFV
uniref:Uncharacterized protein n=1 Tax=Sus scrofa TaxID=9823 RepID=A0A8D1U5D1_PIG